jgi:hypothetical protein
MSLLKEGDALLLNTRDDATLAKWWRELNSWKWPELIPDPEANDAEIPNRRGALMNEIEQRIGLQACLREWNRDFMTDAEFDEFWRTKRTPASVVQRMNERSNAAPSVPEEKK